MALSDYYPELEGWTPVKERPVEESKPQIPTPEVQVSPYLRAVLPLPFQYAGDTIKQYNRPGLSSFRAPVLPPAAQPALNAAVQSTATKAAAQIVPDVSILLNMPPQYVVLGSPAGALGDFIVKWNQVKENYVLSGPAPSASGIVDTAVQANASGSSGSTTIEVAITPSLDSELCLFISAQNIGSFGTVTGPQSFWANHPQASSAQAGFHVWSTLSGPAGTVVDGTFSGQFPVFWSAAIVAFASSPNLQPAIVNEANLQSGQTLNHGTQFNIPTSHAGNTLLLIIASTAPGSFSTQGASIPQGITDTQNNQWFNVTTGFSQNNVGALGSILTTWAAPNIPGGALTITIDLGGAGNTLNFAVVYLFEVANIGNALFGFPTFKPIASLIGGPNGIPVFGASGPNHSSGVVPDPGPTQGFKKFLREDATFQFAMQPVMLVNNVPVAADKQVTINGVSDGATSWGVKINGVSDGG